MLSDLDVLWFMHQAFQNNEFKDKARANIKTGISPVTWEVRIPRFCLHLQKKMMESQRYPYHNKSSIRG